MTGTDVAGAARPVLRVVRGNPDDEEIAALTAVVAGLASATAQAAAEAAPASAARARSRWSDAASRLRIPARPGEDGWRRSAYPA